MDPRLEAVIIRMITEYDFDANIPPEQEGTSVHNFKAMVYGVCDHSFSKKGLDWYNAGLADDEKFASTAAVRAYVQSACEQMRAWAQRP